MNVIKNRNLGIDLLRIVSMFYVVLSHILGFGGILTSAAEWSRQYMFGWAMQIWTVGAANIFALISGYIGYTDKPKPHDFSNYILLWLQVLSYGLFATGIFYFIDPTLVSRSSLIQVLFPFKNRLYWYFNAYTGLFSFIPLLNSAVRNCSVQYLKRLFLIFFLLFSIFEVFSDYFTLADGYSFIWIVILYLMGAIIKKCHIGNQAPSFAIWGGIIVLNVLTWLWKIYGSTIHVGNISIFKESFESPCSPAILICSVLHVIGFSKLKITSPLVKKIITFAAPGTFAVYLLNNQSLVWQHVIIGKFSHLATQSVYSLFFHSVGFSLCFVIVSILIDSLRQRLFRIIRVKQATTYLAKRISKALDFFTKIL